MHTSSPNAHTLGWDGFCFAFSRRYFVVFVLCFTVVVAAKKRTLAGKKISVTSFAKT